MQTAPMNTTVTAKIDGSDPGLQFRSVHIRQALFEPCRIDLALGLKTNEVEEAHKKAVSEWLGATLEIVFKDKEESSIEKKYKGTITSLSATEDGIVLRAFSEDHLLTRGRKHRSFVDLSVQDIVNSVVRESVGSADLQGPGDSIRMKFFQQYQETDAEFLKRLARMDGCVFYHDGEKFQYCSKLGGKTSVSLQESQISGVSLDCNLELNKWRGAPYDFVKHNDPKDLEVESGKYTPPEHPMLSKTYDKSKKVFGKAVDELFEEGVTEKPQFEKFLKHQQSLAAGHFVQVNGETHHPMVSIGRTIQCDDNAILKNPVVVTAISAFFQDNGYNATFEASPADVGAQPEVHHKRRSIGTLQPGIVTDNKDPEKLGRVQIQMVWDDEGSSLPWARILQTGAGGSNGKSYGTHYIPRIGDQVLVGYLHGDPSVPIVLGSLYHSEHKPDFMTENGTEEVLVVRTPQESTIRVLDKKGSEEIIVSMKDDKNIIRLELKEPKITVESKDGTVLVKSKAIQFNADDSIEMTAKKVTVKADTDVSVEAQMSVKLKADTQCNIEAGTTLGLKGSATCTVEGTGGLTLKNAAAQIAMNGPSVNVNNGALEVI